MVEDEVVSIGQYFKWSLKMKGFVPLVVLDELEVNLRVGRCCSPVSDGTCLYDVNVGWLTFLVSGRLVIGLVFRQRSCSPELEIDGSRRYSPTRQVHPRQQSSSLPPLG